MATHRRLLKDRSRGWTYKTVRSRRRSPDQNIFWRSIPSSAGIAAANFRAPSTTMSSCWHNRTLRIRRGLIFSVQGSTTVDQDWYHGQNSRRGLEVIYVLADDTGSNCIIVEKKIKNVTPEKSVPVVRPAKCPTHQSR